MSDAELVRPQLAARMLGVTVDQVRYLAARGRIATVRTIGGHRRYRREDVEAVMRWRGRSTAQGA